MGRDRVGLGRISDDRRRRRRCCSCRRQARRLRRAAGRCQACRRSAAPAAKVTDKIAPSVGRIAAEAGVDPADIPGSGKGSRATKGDALAYVANTPAPAAARSVAEAPARAHANSGPAKNA